MNKVEKRDLFGIFLNKGLFLKFTEFHPMCGMKYLFFYFQNFQF